LVRDGPGGYVPSNRAYPPQAEVLLTFIQSSFDGPWRSANTGAAKCAEVDTLRITRPEAVTGHDSELGGMN
jgi:hypothetical protein